jgi:hypothetical protein
MLERALPSGILPLGLPLKMGTDRRPSTDETSTEHEFLLLTAYIVVVAKVDPDAAVLPHRGHNGIATCP